MYITFKGVHVTTSATRMYSLSEDEANCVGVECPTAVNAGSNFAFTVQPIPLPTLSFGSMVGRGFWCFRLVSEKSFDLELFWWHIRDHGVTPGYPCRYQFKLCLWFSLAWVIYIWYIVAVLMKWWWVWVFSFSDIIITYRYVIFQIYLIYCWQFRADGWNWTACHPSSYRLHHHSQNSELNSRGKPNHFHFHTNILGGQRLGCCYEYLQSHFAFNCCCHYPREDLPQLLFFGFKSQLQISIIRPIWPFSKAIRHELSRYTYRMLSQLLVGFGEEGGRIELFIWLTLRT